MRFLDSIIHNHFLDKAAKHGLGLFLYLFVICTWFAPNIEEALFPTHANEQIVSIEQLPDGGVILVFSAERLRSCDRLSSQWYVQTDNGLKHVPRAGPRETLPDNRPLGSNLSPPNYLPHGGEYYLHISQRCHPLWSSVITLGPFETGLSR